MRVETLPSRPTKEQLRLAEIIVEAKKLETYPDVKWDDFSWGLGDSVLKRAHDKRGVVLYFTRHRQSRDEIYVPFEQPFADFAKSIIRLRGSNRGVGWQHQKGMIVALRYLYESLVRTSLPDLNFLTRFHFQNAVEAAVQSVASKSAYSIGSLLQEVSAFIDDKRLTPVQINFINSVAHPRLGDGRDEESQTEGLGKMPSPSALHALGEASSAPLDDDERVMLRIIDLFVVGGFRSGEALTIPLDCWVTEFALNERTGLPKLDPESGKAIRRHGLRYWPEKGGEMAIKWLPDCAVELARRAVDDLKHLCAEARSVAAVLEADLTRVPLPGNYNPDDMLDRHQLIDALGLNNWGSVRCFMSDLDVRQVEKDREPGRGGNRLLYRVSEIEQALVSRRGRLDVLVRQGGKKQMLSESLCVVFKNQFHAARATLRYLPELVGYKQLMTALGNDAGAPSIFTRRGLTELDGSRMRIKTHAFRHWLNTLGDRGGLSDLEQALWMGRKDPRQNAAYKHGTVEERVKWAREALEDGTLHGGIADAYAAINDPVEKEAFLEAFVAVAHFTPYGVCLHDFAIEPCKYHLNCLRGCGEFMRTKGDKDERQSIRKLRVFTARELKKAEEAGRAGEYGADTWVDHNRRTLAGCDAALAVDDDLEGEKGDTVRVFPGGGVKGKPIDD
jgi:hypothetical protein